MPPVVTRTLRGCLALAALLISAWGQLRAAVETSAHDADDLAPFAADANVPLGRASATCVVVAVSARSTSDAPATPRVAAAPVASAPVVRAAPSPRRGSAGGPRAP